MLSARATEELLHVGRTGCQQSPIAIREPLRVALSLTIHRRVAQISGGGGTNFRPLFDVAHSSSRIFGRQRLSDPFGRRIFREPASLSEKDPSSGVLGETRNVTDRLRPGKQANKPPTIYITSGCRRNGFVRPGRRLAGCGPHCRDRQIAICRDYAALASALAAAPPAGSGNCHCRCLPVGGRVPLRVVQMCRQYGAPSLFWANNITWAARADWSTDL